MSGIKVLSRILIAGLLHYGPASARAQTQLDTVAEIKLPVPSPPGEVGGGLWNSKIAVEKMFSMKVAPDQSVLVLQPDGSGKWPLVRVRNWWTQEPVSEVLNIPEWSAADIKNGDLNAVDLQVTPDGRYAVAIASVGWHLPRKPFGPRQPDMLITVIDLHRWQIAGSIHTADIGDANFTRARLLSDNRMVLVGWDQDQTGRLYQHFSDRRHRLISIPDLILGPQCRSSRPEYPFHGRDVSAAEWTNYLDILDRQNDESCEEVLKASGVESVKTLDSLIYKGHGLEPRNLLLQSLGITGQAELSRPSLPMDIVEEEAIVYYNYPSQSRFDTSPSASPVQSTQYLWYGMLGTYKDKSHSYELEVFDADGRKLRAQAPEHLLCSGHAARTCVCRIDDVSEQQDTLLTYCRIYSLSFDDHQVPHKQWLSVFRPDDLSEVGLVNISRDKETSEAFAVAEGREYVVAVELGQTLRVYAVPDRP